VGEAGPESRGTLAARLRQRLPELRAAAATRVRAIDDPSRVPDPAYREGLEAAVPAAVEYSIACLEGGEHRPPEVPVEVLAQARLDARDRVQLDTATRRYLAVNALVGDLLAEEAERAGIAGGPLRRLLAIQATSLDRLLAAAGAEHAREAQNRPTTVAERRRECVKRLLAGELVDTDGLGYELDWEHVALMAKGEGSKEALRDLAARLDRRLLAVRREEEPIWASWLGGRRPTAVSDVVRALVEMRLDGLTFTVGEPADGLEGWRFSHAQAKAALPVAARRGAPVVRFLDVAVEAAVVRDELIATSLRRRYLKPLEASRDGGELSRRTLRAYFAAERNVSATAAALNVDRRTVRNRLATIEGLLGRPLNGSAADMEIALRLGD
jgi:PucR-like helix-turn-helix protein/diguanylate cyclase with GGDEF domain